MCLTMNRDNDTTIRMRAGHQTRRQALFATRGSYNANAKLKQALDDVNRQEEQRAVRPPLAVSAFPSSGVRKRASQTTLPVYSRATGKRKLEERLRKVDAAEENLQLGRYYVYDFEPRSATPSSETASWPVH